MTNPELFLALLAGLAIGGVVLLWQRGRWLTERGELAVRIAQLDTELENERASLAEKLRLLEDARAQSADAFRALSAEALKSNNQAFLELARTSMERFQESARGDLDARNKAVESLVKP
ncbi:MAG: hypothetical protein P4L70_07250, partial [Parasulfuritortus sp.]|nr:hypothetical protein [Parasulfuritortus sp.]